MTQVQGPFAFPIGVLAPSDQLQVAQEQREAALRALAVRNPPRWLLLYPGASPDSYIELKQLLRKDFESHHIYWNTIRWHNHLLHHAVVIYTLGARPDRLQELFSQHASFARPLMAPLPHPITRDNWTSMLGKESSYSSFLLFFLSEIDALGPVATIERYIFTHEANTQGVAMLARLFSGILHPIIHLGHALECGGNDSLAQALAEAAVTYADMENLFPSSEVHATLQLEPKSELAVQEHQEQAVHGVAPKFEFLSHEELANYAYKGPNAFEVLAQLDAAEHLDDCGDIQAGDTVIAGAHSHGLAIAAIAKSWSVDVDKGWQEVLVKAEELVWLITAILGTTSSPVEQLKMDFFFCHLQTPLFSYPVLLPLLSPSSRVAFLTMHFRTACCSWTSRGKPRFRFEELCLTPERRELAVPPPSFNPEIQFTPRHEWEREIEEHNLWWKIGQLAMMHLDEHVAKSLRVLMWAGAMLGSSRPCLPFLFLPKSDSIPKPKSLPLFVPRGTLSKDVAQGDEWGPRYRNSVLPECIARIDHTLYLRTALLVLEALPIIDKDRAKRFKDAYKHNWSLLPTGREAAYRLDVWKLLAGKEATPADPPIDSASCASE